MKDRVKWIVWRRKVLAKHIPGFWAHWDTYADAKCSFSAYNKLYKRSILTNVRLGRFTYIAGARSGNSCFGAFCSVSPEAIVGGLGIHPTHWISTHPAFYSTAGQAGLTFSNHNKFKEQSRTCIGNDVWVGARAVILDGVHVADGAIIAAGAVVVDNVQPYTVVGGVPARILRCRFSEDVVAELLAWKWWELPTDVLKKLAPEFVGRKHWTAADIGRLREMSVAMSGETQFARNSTKRTQLSDV